MPVLGLLLKELLRWFRHDLFPLGVSSLIAEEIYVKMISKRWAYKCVYVGGCTIFQNSRKKSSNYPSLSFFGLHFITHNGNMERRKNFQEIYWDIQWIDSYTYYIVSHTGSELWRKYINCHQNLDGNFENHMNLRK